MYTTYAMPSDNVWLPVRPRRAGLSLERISPERGALSPQSLWFVVVRAQSWCPDRQRMVS